MAIGRGDRDLHAWLHELREVGAELGSRYDQAAEGVQVVAAQRAVADGRRTAGIAIIDQHAEALAEHGQRQAYLDAVAILGRLPRAADPRLDEHTLLAVLPRFDTACSER